MKDNKNEEVTKGERIFVLISALLMICFSSYLLFRDNSVPESELKTIQVTLKVSPRYYQYKIKSTTYNGIILTTNEYRPLFKITSMTFKATNHTIFKSDIYKGDTLHLQVKKSELSQLDDLESIDVYGLQKNRTSYIDTISRTKLANEDTKYSYFFVVMGLVRLPYGFIKTKPLLSIDKAIMITIVLELILLLAINPF